MGKKIVTLLIIAMGCFGCATTGNQYGVIYNNAVSAPQIKNISYFLKSLTLLAI